MNKNFKNDDWWDTSDKAKLFYREHKKSGSKALRLVAQNEIQKGFFTEKWFVKTTSSEMPDVVIVPLNESIKRDKS